MAQQLLSDRIETTIISNLFFNEDFTRKALPFIKPEYFSKSDERILYGEIEKLVENYKNFGLEIGKTEMKVLILLLE